MVKGFDTTQSDPSKILLDRFLSLFDSSRTTITPQQANSYTLNWLSNKTSTSQVYKKFNQFKQKPKLIFRKKCPKSFFSSAPSEGDNHFGGYQKQQQIHICLNNIHNKIQLKQNIDRELHLMYHSNLTNQSNLNQKQKDKLLMANLYESCKQGYRNYAWEESTENRAAKKCAVYLFRRRSHSNLPPDSLFRYASIIADEVCL